MRSRDRGVRLIGVTVSNLSTAAEEDLFEAPHRTRLRQLTAAVDKVRGKFGFDAVTLGSIVDLRRRRPPRD